MCESVEWMIVQMIFDLVAGPNVLADTTVTLTLRRRLTFSQLSSPILKPHRHTRNYNPETYDDGCQLI
jgi:hypothetical protein